MKKFTEITSKIENQLDGDYRVELCEKLQNAFAEEINAWYGYMITSKFLTGPCRSEISKFFDETAKDEFEDHAMWILERLSQLRMTPNKVLGPSSLAMAKHPYMTPTQLLSGQLSTLDAITMNIKGEKDAIETYRALEMFTRDIDPVSNAKIKQIWADEEEHLSELNDFYDDIIAQQSTQQCCNVATCDDCTTCDCCDDEF